MDRWVAMTGYRMRVQQLTWMFMRCFRRGRVGAWAKLVRQGLAPGRVASSLALFREVSGVELVALGGVLRLICVP